MTVLSNSSRSMSNGSEKFSSMVEPWKVEVYRYVVPLILLFCVISCAANLYILASVRWLRKSPTPNLIFTLSLTASDTWVSLAMGVGLVLNSYLPIVRQLDVLGYSNFCFNIAYEALRVGAMITSVFHLLALALNQYLSILRPLHYYSFMTPEIVVPVVVAMWILPPVGFMLGFSLVPGQAFRSRYCRGIEFLTQFQFRIFVSLTIFIPLLIMVAVYTHILVIVIHSRRVRLRSLGSRRGSTKISEKFRPLNTTALMLGTYVLCWLPNVILFVTHCHNCIFPLHSYGLQVFWLSVAANSLVVFKCLLDPIIYGARVSEIREALTLMNISCLNFVHRYPRKFDMRRRRNGLVIVRRMAERSRMYAYNAATDSIATARVGPYGSICCSSSSSFKIPQLTDSQRSQQIVKETTNRLSTDIVWLKRQPKSSSSQFQMLQPNEKIDTFL